MKQQNEEIKSTDQQEAQMVKQALKDDQGLSTVAKDIHVTVKDGTVTLDGQVSTDQQMDLATNTASALAVGDKVKNKMEIIHPLKVRPALVLFLGLSLICLGTLAWADDDRGDHQHYRGDRYRYHDGQWHGQGDVIVADVPVGGVIESLPVQYTTVVVGNNSYYYDNTRYYSRSPDGTYIVVASPVVVEEPARPLIQIKL